MTIRVEQTSSYVGNNRWDWQVWLSGPDDELDRIDHVTYTLHPSFSNPVREISSRADGFKLKSSGWGEFKIFLEVVSKDGSSEILSHALQLEPPMELEDVETVPPSSIAQAARPTRARTADHIAFQMEAGTDAMPTAEAPIKTVFISGGIADTEAIDLLKASLRARNVKILGADEIPSGVPFGAQIESLIGQADIAAFVVSGRPSRWVSQEIALAQRYGKRIVPVLVGESGQLPDSLSGLQMQNLSLDNPDAIIDLTDFVLAEEIAPVVKPKNRL